MNIGTPPFSEPVNPAGVMSQAWSEFMAKVSMIITNQVESGTTAQRPTKNLYTGRRYFDLTLGLPIWYKTTSWVKADGTAA